MKILHLIPARDETHANALARHFAKLGDAIILVDSDKLLIAAKEGKYANIKKPYKRANIKRD